MQICGTFCLVFQFSALQPFSWISSFGNRPGRVKLCYGTYLIGMVTILSIFIHLSVVDRSVFYHYAVQTNNQYIIELINNEPTWIGFSSAIKPTVIAFGIFVTVPDLCVASLAIFLTIKIWFIIEADKSRVTPLTLSIERNLYHTFLFRTANMVTFYTIPYFGIAASIFFEIQIPQLGIFFHSIICFHILIHGIGSILMIRPLRVYIFNKCLRKKILSLPSNHSSGSNTLPTTFTARSEKISLRI
uniref:Uncharacterized protein n=1 Tax=Panagrolaimus davidi TaxID=227884 RepID=A0A914P883_9BILA